MIKKTLILLLGLTLCLTNGFADEAPEPVLEFRTAEGDAYIQGTEDIRRAPNFIFGTPDFEKMRDLPPDSQDYQLGRKVGYLFTAIAPGSPYGFICTGFLVGPDLLMTNHHCVHDAFGRPAPLELMEIYMDYYQEPDVDPTQGGITAGVTAIVKADAPLDYALLRLDKPIGNTYGWLELDTTTPATPGQSVKIIHHSDGRSKEISRRNSQIVEIPTDLADAYPFLIGYLADTEGGSSGSPIFLRDGTGVIGINHSGWFDRDGQPIFNGGSLMSWIVPEIEQWLPKPAAPDLTVESARIDKVFLRPGESFTLSLTVRNQGTTAASTTLRYYYSTDDTLSIDDAPVGTDTVGSLPTDGTVEKSITLTAPNYVGTYYYGACVDPAAHETATYNNCSAAVSIHVSNTPPFWMYWSAGGSIRRATSDGTNPQVLVTEQGFIGRLALDVTRGKMYWTNDDTGKIQRANLDGSNVEDLVTGLKRPYGIALDGVGGKMYWADQQQGKIQRANLDGSNVEDLITGLAYPLGIALDVAGGKMYWTIWNPGRIQRANLDGSNVEDLITTTTQFSLPVGIALDVAGGKMYWTVPEAGEVSKIQRANLDGSNMEVLITVPRTRDGWAINDIALDVADRKMFWTVNATGKIQRANLDGSNVEDLITEELAYPNGIALGISTASPPTTPISFNPNTIADQTFTVGTSVNLFLPVATGGTPPYRYTLSPLPNGLVFEPSTRELRGVPMTVMDTTVLTYMAVDATGALAALTFTIAVIEGGAGPLDVNGDGRVDVLDLVVVAFFYGKRGVELPADVNADGVVNVQDFIAVAAAVDAAGDLSPQVVEAALWAAIAQAENAEAGAPVGLGTRPRLLSLAYRNVATAFADARHLATNAVRLGKGVAVLEALLHLLAEMRAIPETTALLPNYPNPFNPETWLPYQLATPAAVRLSIYSGDGRLVRMLDVGHQAAGVYRSRHRAAYWDGKNQLGEKVASGVYFYTLTADDFTATRKLLIAK